MASLKSKNHGKLTAAVARSLRAKFESQGWIVLCDLGGSNNGRPSYLVRIVSWFGDVLKKERRLAYLDIAVVERNDQGRAVALIEIEEGIPRPKVLLGDLFATLLGDHIEFKRRTLQIGKWTSFILVAHGKSKSEQIAFIEKKLIELKPHLSSGNASIGHVILDTYDSQSDLEAKVTRLVEEAIKPASS